MAIQNGSALLTPNAILTAQGRLRIASGSNLVPNALLSVQGRLLIASGSVFVNETQLSISATIRAINLVNFAVSSNLKINAQIAYTRPPLHVIALLKGESNLTVDARILPWRDAVDPYREDPLNLGINATAGSDIIFRAATGLEKSWADVDAQRLIATYAELPRDQWDPWRITTRNLSYLAWAMGVNLWEDDWPEEFQRYWVAKQWTYKYERGSLIGLKDFVHALNAGYTMDAEVLRVIRPPAIAYALNSQTPEQRAAYVARFAQLRGYPYVGRIQLPYVCYVGKHHAADLSRVFQKNGSFLGPLRKLFPTHQDAGGNYTFTYTLWDHGVETLLTHRTIAHVTTGESAGWGFTPGVSQYDDQVVLPSDIKVDYYCSEEDKYLNGGAKFGIFAGSSPPLRTISVSRSGPLSLTQGKAQYTSIVPTDQLLQLLPEKVTQKHPIRKTEWYAGPKRYLGVNYNRHSGMPRSNAWQFLFDRWYLFDPNRVPDARKNGVYMGYCRFGIHKYTAEALIKVRVKQSTYTPTTAGYMYGYFNDSGRTRRVIDKIRRGVTASMAIRDTVLIDTNVTRRLQLHDIIRPDGSHEVGQWVQN